MKTRIYGSLILLVFIVPSFYIFYRALFPFNPAQFLNIPIPILSAMAGNSICLSLSSSILAGLIGLVCAAAVVYYDFPGRSFVESALCLPLALPSYLVAAVYKDLAHRHFTLGINLENFWGASLVFAFSLYPYFYILLKTSLANQSVAYSEVGKSLGFNRLQRFTKITIPMAMPAIFLGMALIVMEIISDYGTVNILGIRTLTTGIYTIWFSADNPGLAAQLSMFLYIVPILAIFIVMRLSRNVSFNNPPNLAAGSDRRPLHGWGYAALGFSILVPLFIGFIFPTAILVVWAVSETNTVIGANLYTDLFNTLSLAALVAVICTVVSVFLSYLERVPRSGIYIGIVTWIINAQYAVPGIVVGISLLFLTGAFYELPILHWFSNTIAIIVFACVVRYFCFASFNIESGMKKIFFRYDEVSSTIGRGRVFALFNLHVPLLKPSIIAGCILVFINAAKELTMSLVLQPFDYSSLALRLYSYARMDMLKKGSPWALFMILIVVYPVFSMNKWLGYGEKRK
jgi:iron(III) transport system permease protein